MESHIYLGSLSYLYGDILTRNLIGSSKKYIRKERINSIERIKELRKDLDLSHTDDYEIFLQSLKSLLINGYDPGDMAGRYLKLIGEGRDINPGIREAMRRHFEDSIPLSKSGGIRDSDNGNGILLRGFSLALYLYDKMDKYGEDELYEYIYEYSSLSHQHYKSKISLSIFINLIFSLIKNRDRDIREVVRESMDQSFEHFKDIGEIQYTLNSFKNIFSLDFNKRDIHGGDFVIDTLELIIYSLINSNSFDESLICALSFGKNTSTNVGLTCGLSGIYYGLGGDVYDYLGKTRDFSQINDFLNGYGGKYES